MRVVVTGGAGFIGRAVVGRLTDRGDDVVALVRDPAKTTHPAGDHLQLVASDLSDGHALTEQLREADGVIHAAGSYRVGIKRSEQAQMWDANVGTTERVLDAAIAAGVARLVYVSTNGIHGDTHRQIVDESHRRDLGRGFLSYYDETKFRAHEAAERRVAAGAPVVIVQPGQTFGPHDHSEAGAQLQQAHAGRLRYMVLASAGLAWAHVHDLAEGIVAAFDRGQVGQSYSLGGECLTVGQVIGIAARVGGHEPPRMTVPTALLRLVAPINDRLGGLPGFPANLREVIQAGDGVTYWVSNAKARRELGYNPRSVEHGVADTWGRTAQEGA